MFEIMATSQELFSMGASKGYILALIRKGDPTSRRGTHPCESDGYPSDCGFLDTCNTAAPPQCGKGAKRREGSAPSRGSSFTTSPCPPDAASCSAVLFLISSRTSVSSLADAARCSALSRQFCALISAPCWSSCSTTSSCSLLAAQKNASAASKSLH
jgi:hypothetical protein